MRAQKEQKKACPSHIRHTFSSDTALYGATISPEHLPHGKLTASNLQRHGNEEFHTSVQFSSSHAHGHRHPQQNDPSPPMPMAIPTPAPSLPNVFYSFKRSISELFQIDGFSRLVVACSVLYSIEAILQVTCGQFVYVCGFQPSDGGFFLAIMIICGVFSNLLFGFILNRTQKYREAVLSNCCAVFFALLLLFAAMIQKTYVATAIGFAFLGFCLFPYYGIFMNSVAEITFPIPVSSPFPFPFPPLFFFFDTCSLRLIGGDGDRTRLVYRPLYNYPLRLIRKS